jgi:hypothetical protein
MANTKKRSTEAKCIPIETLTRRLAESFGPLNWDTRESIAIDDVASWLEIEPEEVEQLIASGLLKATKHRYSQDHIDLTEMVRFLDANPWWFRVRAEKNVQGLRDAILERIITARHQRRMARRAARKASGKAVAA